MSKTYTTPPPTASTMPEAADPHRCGVYLLTPPSMELAAFTGPLAAALDGGAAALQIRLKGASDGEIRRAVDTLTPIAHARGTAVILNDDPILARECGCDGVHIGQQDTPYEEARRIMGSNAIVGVTCHDSRHLGMVAAEAGSDYVAFGAFFPSSTKNAPTRAPLEVLSWWRDMIVTPCVAIGGVTVHTAGVLAAAGADFVAACAGIWHHPEGPAAAVKGLHAAIADAQPQDAPPTPFERSV